MTAKLKIAAVSGELQDRGATEPEIEITPEMIEAGVEAMLPFENAFDEPRQSVRHIFGAMVRASRAD